MSEKNPFRNLRKRVLKRELVKIHGQRTITAKLLQDNPGTFSVFNHFLFSHAVLPRISRRHSSIPDRG